MVLTHTYQSFGFFLEVFRSEIPEGKVGLDPLIPHGVKLPRFYLYLPCAFSNLAVHLGSPNYFFIVVNNFLEMA